MLLSLFRELDKSMMLAALADMAESAGSWARLLRLVEVQRCKGVGEGILAWLQTVPTNVSHEKVVLAFAKESTTIFKLYI